MKTRKKILLQGIAAVAVTTVGLIVLGATLTAKQSRTVAFEYRSEPIELEPTAAKRPELERRRPASKGPRAEPPVEQAAEADQGPPAGAEPKNGDPPAGMLEGIAAKMIDNAIATFWSVINALIVAVTVRRYSKAEKE